jgi:hypothetical protein
VMQECVTLRDFSWVEEWGGDKLVRGGGWWLTERFWDCVGALVRVFRSHSDTRRHV